MGKSDIKKFLNEKSKISKQTYINKEKTTILSDKIIAIDLYPWMYKFLHNERKDYMTSMICFLNYLQKNNIKPIFVIDGKPPFEKATVLKKRLNKKMKSSEIVKHNEQVLEHIESNITKATTHEEKHTLQEEKRVAKEAIQKYRKRTIKITKEHIDNIKELFDFCQIPYIHIKDKEADYVCAQLVINKIAYACLSNDYDLITHQCPMIIRNLDMAHNTIEVICLSAITSMITLTTKQLTDLIILNGTDYQSKRHPYDYNYIRNILKTETVFSNILQILHFGKQEYDIVNDIYTSPMLNSCLIENIFHYKNIDTFNRNIIQESIDSFYSLLIPKYKLKNRDLYNFKYNLEKLFTNINISLRVF